MPFDSGDAATIVAPLAKPVSRPLAETPKPLRAKTPYLRNADLLAEILRCKETGVVSNKLAQMLMLMAKRIASKPNFRGYTWREDMECEAVAQLCTGNGRSPVPTILRFNEEKSKNPFGYVTTAMRHVFIRRIQLEHRQRDIRDELNIAHGFAPSYDRQTRDAMQAAIEQREAMERDPS